MGLIKAALGSVSGVLADQWKEYFYCDTLPADVLAIKGQKRVSGRSSNTKGSSNIISNGSVISVNEGQCMMIVEQGKVVDICAEPGEYIYDMSTEPSVFSGNLGDSIKAVFNSIGKRFTFGGEPPKDQRIYYFNTKEILGNKYGTPAPISITAFVDRSINRSLTIGIRCFGEYSFRICNPLLFYTSVCGNVEQPFTRGQMESQMRTELLTALSPAFGKVSQQGIIYSDLTMHTMEMADTLNQILSNKWRDLRGLEIVSFGISSIRPDEESEKKIREMQSSLFYSDATLAGARLAEARANAMETAAGNTAGAMTGFMGMGMAGNMGGMGAVSDAQLFTIGQQQRPAPAAAGQNGWKCSCGATATGKFCPECGAKKPAGIPQYKCDKCGWEPEKDTKPPKFCPECGDIFDAGDIKK